MIYYGGELYHHGVLGQKWGVRNGPPYPLSVSNHSVAEKRKGWQKSLDKSNKSQYAKNSHRLTDDEKKLLRHIAIGMAVTVGLLGVAYVGRRAYVNKSNEVWALLRNKINQRAGTILSETPLDSLSNDDRVIKGNTVVQRIVSANSSRHALIKENLYITPNWDAKYVSVTDNDKRMYKWGDFLAKGKKYAVQMTVNKDLKMPSEKKRVSAFVDLVENNEDFRRKLSSDLVDAGVATQWMSGSDLQNNPQKYYGFFQRQLGNKKSLSRDIYFNRIRDMGYRALIDDNDAGLYGDMPIILLNPETDVVINGARHVNFAMKFLNLMKIST